MGIVLRWLSNFRNAPVAQGIEQRFPVPRAGGSNPSRCAFGHTRRGPHPLGYGPFSFRPVFLFCCFAVFLFCCFSVLLFCCFSVLLFFCFTVLRFTVLLFFALLFFCSSTFLFFSFLVLLFLRPPYRKRPLSVLPSPYSSDIRYPRALPPPRRTPR